MAIKIMSKPQLKSKRQLIFLCATFFIYKMLPIISPCIMFVEFKHSFLCCNYQNLTKKQKLNLN